LKGKVIDKDIEKDRPKDASLKDKDVYIDWI